MIRRPPRSTLDRSSAASDVYKRQGGERWAVDDAGDHHCALPYTDARALGQRIEPTHPVSYTHLRAHETVLDLVCRLLLEQKKTTLRQLVLSPDL